MRFCFFLSISDKMVFTPRPMGKKNKIKLKSAGDVEKMRISGKVASDVLQRSAAFIAPGKTTQEIDLYARDLMKEHGCRSAFKGYRGFPAYTCISVNDEVVHGIGCERVIQDGDIVSIDVGIQKNGWIGDNALTVAVGNISDEARDLMIVTEQSLFESISFARAGESLADLCGAVEEYVIKHGYTVVRDLVGHGVGKDLHEEPQVPNYRPTGKDVKLKAGMVLAIEPMINQGTGDVECLEDQWTIVTKDRKLSAHFEHTVLVTDGEPEILTARPRLTF